MADSEDAKVVELLAAGVPQAAVAAQLRLSQSKVSRIKRANEKVLASTKGDNFADLMGKTKALAEMREEIYETFHAAEARGEDPEAAVEPLWAEYMKFRDADFPAEAEKRWSRQIDHFYGSGCWGCAECEGA